MSDTGTLQDTINVAFGADKGETPPAQTDGYNGFQGAEPPRAVQNQVTQQHPAQQTESRAFTAEDIERARQEEKEKVYSRLSESEKKLADMAAEVERFRKQREQEEAELQKQQEAQAEEERRRREEELDAKSLVKEVEQRWEQRLASEREERERLAALLEREREVTQFNEWKAQRLAADDVRNEIAPSMLRFIQGYSAEEIEAAIEQAKAATAETLSEIQAAQQAQYQQMPGVSPRGPVVGPMEQQGATQELSAQQLRDMDMATFMKNRGALLQAASNQFRGRS